MNYCYECGSDSFKIKVLIKGSIIAKRVERCTCNSCGTMWTRESDHNEGTHEREERQLREQAKFDQIWENNQRKEGE